MNKTITTLMTISILLFLVYIVANYYSEYKRIAYKPDIVTFKFKLDTDNIDRITLEKGPEKIQLIKKKRKWILENLKYYADISKVMSLVSRINEIKEAKVTSIDPTQFDVYSVSEKTGVKVSFYANNKELQSLIIGKEAENRRDSFFRLPAENKVYLVENNLSDEVSIKPQDWLKKELRTVEEKDNIYKIIVSGESDYTFVKSGTADGAINKKWWIKRPRLAPASDSKLSDLVNKFGYLTINDVDRTKRLSECIQGKPKYKIIVKYYVKRDNKSIRKRYVLKIGNQINIKNKDNYYATIYPEKICYVISSTYPDSLRIAWFEAIEREIIKSDISTYEVSSLEFDNFIPGKTYFKKKKFGKNDYKFVGSYKGRFKLFQYDKVKNFFEILRSIKAEDYEYRNKSMKFDRSFVTKTETKDVYSYSFSYNKDSKDCYGYSNRYPKLLIKVLCSDLSQIEDNLRNLFKLKIPENPKQESPNSK